MNEHMKEEGYVSGADIDPHYDYTNLGSDEPETSSSSSDVPFKVPTEVDDDEGFSTTFSVSTPVEEIEKGTFRYLDVGKYILEIKDIQWADKDDSGFPYKHYVKRPDGKVVAMTMLSRKIKVIFCVPGDDNLTCSDNFILPPQTESQLEVFEYGFANELSAAKNTREQGGLHSKKLVQFLSRIGFQCDSKGRLPKEAQKFGNWKYYPGSKIRRRVKLELIKVPGKDRQDPNNPGKVIPGRDFINVKMFSYAIAPLPEALQKIKEEQLAAKKAAQSGAAQTKPTEETPVEKPVSLPESKPVKGRKNGASPA